jgi:hypothetical protein
MSTHSLLRDVAAPVHGNLLESITIKHGPAGLLGRFFLAADQAARERGLSLQLHRELGSLVETNRQLRAEWGAPIVPVFNPEHSDLSEHNSFWISGHDHTGRVVATQAARIFDMTGSNAAAELESLRVFYARPQPHLAEGARCDVQCPAAERVTGRVVYSGGGWYHPSFRGCGLSRILPRISRSLAYTQWKSDYTISLLETVLVEKKVFRSYGYTNHDPLITLSGYREPLFLHLIWMERAELLADLARYLALPADRPVENDVRMTDTDETNIAPSERHGSSRRS